MSDQCRRETPCSVSQSDRVPCNVRCDRQLRVGHQCVCGEVCPQDFCQQRRSQRRPSWNAHVSRKVLLLIDNAPSHKWHTDDFPNLEIVALPPNTTSKLQPLDAGIIASFKSQVRKQQLTHALDILEQGCWNRKVWRSRASSTKQAVRHRRIGHCRASVRERVRGAELHTGARNQQEFRSGSASLSN
jgi:hypothetical protein